MKKCHKHLIFFKAIKFPNKSDNYFVVNIIDRAIIEVFIESYPTDPLEVTLVSTSERDDEEFIECLKLLNSPHLTRSNSKFKTLGHLSDIPTKSSIGEPPLLELR